MSRCLNLSWAWAGEMWLVPVYKDWRTCCELLLLVIVLSRVEAHGVTDGSIRNHGADWPRGLRCRHPSQSQDWKEEVRYSALPSVCRLYMALSLPFGWLYDCLAGMCWRKSGLRGRRSAVGSLPIKRLVKCDALFLIHWLCLEELVREKMNCRWLWLPGCSTLTLLNSRRLGLRRFCSSGTCSYLVSSVWTYLVDKVSYAGLLCLHCHGLLWRWRHVSVI